MHAPVLLLQVTLIRPLPLVPSTPLYCGNSVASLVPRPSALPLKKRKEKTGEEGLVQLVQKGSWDVALLGGVIEGAKYV